jgi:hypothetical protein
MEMPKMEEAVGRGWEKTVEKNGLCLVQRREAT